jgi:hypothetical protein
MCLYLVYIIICIQNQNFSKIILRCGALRCHLTICPRLIHDPSLDVSSWTFFSGDESSLYHNIIHSYHRDVLSFLLCNGIFWALHIASNIVTSRDGSVRDRSLGYRFNLSASWYTVATLKGTVQRDGSGRNKFHSMDRFVHLKIVNISIPTKTSDLVPSWFRLWQWRNEVSSIRHPNWFPYCQSKNWCCLQVTAWEGVRDATKHADMCIQGPYLTPTQPGIEHILAGFYKLFTLS